MRENKFRVYCEFEFDGKLEKRMESPASWFLLTQGGKLWTYDPGQPARPIEKEYKVAIPLFYTGLKDKNGKEICEGDIVNLVDIDDGDTGNYTVTWEKSGYFTLKPFIDADGYIPTLGHFTDKDSNDGYYTIKIIGNIYENPELLKGGQ